MTCALAVTGVTGITTGGTLTSIVVAGESTNCNSVNVQIQCGTAQASAPNVQVDTSTSPWTWTVTFQAIPEGFACTKEITVTAECDEQGESCKTAFSGPLTCITDDTCPNITFLQTISPVPNSPGNYMVTVTATLSSSSAYAAELIQGADILETINRPNGGYGNMTSPLESLPANTSRTYEVVITSPATCGSTQLMVTAPGSGGGNGGNGGGGFCNALLWTALALFATGSVLGVIAVCTGQPVSVLGGVAAGTLALGLIILTLWARLCGRLPGGCETLRTANCIVTWIQGYGWIIALLLLLDGAWCGAAAGLDWVGWGYVLFVIGQVQLLKNCPAPLTCSVLPLSSSAK
jgi:hypothetical protein